ncbi:MAG: hypothetical protein P1V51_14005 [Deltaproteobacteria bacterium]|nr:hypothetical protein [Deltaproteobacteria bacterium]
MREAASERLAIALFSAAALSLQVALGRLLAVTLWYHFAFLIVSTALLGYGLSGAWLALRPAARERPLAAFLLRVGAGQAATTLLAVALLRLLPFEPLRIAAEPSQLLWALAIQLGLIAPFFFSGLAVGRILIDHAREAGRLYALDLLGAGAGAVLALFGVGLMGPHAVIGAGAAAALAAGALMQTPRRRALPALLAAAGLLLLGAVAEPLTGLRVAADKRLGEEPVGAILADPERVEASAWDEAARLDLVRGERHRTILLDAGAAVVRVPHLTRPLEELPPLRDATALSFFARPPRKVLVLGSGAGWEVASALTHGAEEVTGVELAATLSGWLRGPLHGWTRGLIDDPRVRWVDGEARSFVHRSDERWDQILSIHTISNAAAQSGALALAESHTLTLEAIGEYLEHLEEDGLLYVTRPEAQMPKLVATLSRVLKDAGKDPFRHLAVLRLGPAPAPGTDDPGGAFTAGVLASPTPFRRDQLEALDEAARQVGMAFLYAPHRYPGHGGPTAEALRAALERRPAPGRDPALLEPATDDRPFFNRRRSWSSLRLSDFTALFDEGERSRLALEDRPVAELSLALLLLQTLLVAFGVTALLGRRRRQEEADRPAGAWVVQAYFALLGLGFAAVELGLVHRLGLLLGKPGLTFAVSVAGLLLFSGLGSHALSRVAARLSPLRLLLGVALGVGLTGVLLGGLEGLLLGASLPLRTLGALLALAPAGLALGLPFPFGLTRLSGASAGERGRAWAINGFASVVGASLSVVVATGAGLAVVFACGAGAYVLAGVLARRWPIRWAL